MDQRPHYTNPVHELVRADCETLIRLALQEDAPSGDVTSLAILPLDQRGEGILRAREDGILCGLPLISILLDIDCEMHPAGLSMDVIIEEGSSFCAGDTLLKFRGPLQTMLRLERVILNFLQYLSGISTTTHQGQRQAGTDIYILDTRKTLPGYRRLVKYAVYIGGGTNHRLSLSDMAMIKDNHIAAAGGISAAAQKFRKTYPELPLEIEADRVDQVEEALRFAPEAILLDNMSREDMIAAIKLIQKVSPAKRPFIEISGGWTPDRLHELEDLGPIGLSMGYLTHTTRFLDLGLDLEPDAVK